MPDLHWFLTWRTYGSWLAGDDRGFVGWTHNGDRQRILENAPGTPQSRARPHLRNYAIRRMRGPAISLQPVHGADLLAQFRETSRVRGWDLLAVAVLSTHIHLVVGVEGNPEGQDVLGDFKSYASRRLNERYGKPANGSWWSESGSRRVIKHEGDLIAAVRYVATQPGAYLKWLAASVHEWMLREQWVIGFPEPEAPNT